MKFFIRQFFKTLRMALGPFMLLWEKLTRPQGLVRTPAEQAAVDKECKKLVLYQYQTCPFCIKVRQEISRLSLRVERIDAQKEGQHREDLVRGVGKAKVPCLKITDQAGNSQWLTDSDKIKAYLQGRFASKQVLPA